MSIRIIKGIVWSFSGTVISQGLGMAAAIITARLLGVVSFGELGMINTTIGGLCILPV